MTLNYRNIYCINFNSSEGCNNLVCLYTHKKAPKNYKQGLCYCAGYEHDYICSRGYKCKFARNLCEYIDWKSLNMSKEEVELKTRLCFFEKKHDKKCEYSHTHYDQSRWIELYNYKYNIY